MKKTKNGETIFELNDEIIGTDGKTKRYLKTSTGKFQFLTIDPKTNEPVKRGRKNGSVVTEEMTLYRILQSSLGKKGASAAKAAAVEIGLEDEFNAIRIPVGTKWSGGSNAPKATATPTAAKAQKSASAKPLKDSPAKVEAL